MAIGLVNNTKGVRRVGDVRIAPGSAAVLENDAPWKTNKIVAAWLENGELEIVAVEAVAMINEGMDKKKAIAETKAKQKEKDTPPPKP